MVWSGARLLVEELKPINGFQDFVKPLQLLEEHVMTGASI